MSHDLVTEEQQQANILDSPWATTNEPWAATTEGHVPRACAPQEKPPK